ncbi:MAG: 5 protein [Candidatus Poribacteria bacterium]|nr:5 protein [Candidatus Poribacteria bacterium]
MFNDDIITVLSTFSPLFSINVWNYAQTLLTGAILCNNQRFVLWLSCRTVAAILRVMGLSKDKHFSSRFFFTVLFNPAKSIIQPTSENQVVRLAEGYNIKALVSYEWSMFPHCD